MLLVVKKRTICHYQISLYFAPGLLDQFSVGIHTTGGANQHVNRIPIQAVLNQLLMDLPDIQVF